MAFYKRQLLFLYRSLHEKNFPFEAFTRKKIIKWIVFIILLFEPILPRRLLLKVWIDVSTACHISNIVFDGCLYMHILIDIYNIYRYMFADKYISIYVYVGIRKKIESFYMNISVCVCQWSTKKKENGRNEPHEKSKVLW